MEMVGYKPHFPHSFCHTRHQSAHSSMAFSLWAYHITCIVGILLMSRNTVSNSHRIIHTVWNSLTCYWIAPCSVLTSPSPVLCRYSHLYYQVQPSDGAGYTLKLPLAGQHTFFNIQILSRVSANIHALWRCVLECSVVCCKSEYTENYKERLILHCKEIEGWNEVLGEMKMKSVVFTVLICGKSTKIESIPLDICVITLIDLFFPKIRSGGLFFLEKNIFAVKKKKRQTRLLSCCKMHKMIHSMFITSQKFLLLFINYNMFSFLLYPQPQRTQTFTHNCMPIC